MRVLSVVDGDTIHAQVDLGFDQYTNKTLRLAGINAPEMSTEEGKLAKQALIDLLQPHGPGVIPQWDFTIETIKDKREKYGRYLATIFRNSDDLNINQDMVTLGCAVPYMPGV